MTHIHWVTRQNKLEIPKEKDKDNKREVHKCDGRGRDPNVLVDPPKPTHKTEVSCLLFVYYKSRKREL
jgi:hypothetical protein